MRKISLFVVLLLVAAGLIFAGGGSQSGTGAKTHVIKFGLSNAIDNPKDDCEATWAIAFKAEVEKNSGGAIRVDFYPNKQLGNANEMMQGVGANTLELSTINSNSFAAVYPQSMILSTPGIFESEAEVDTVLESDWGKDFLLKMAQTTNHYVISARSNGMRCFTTSNRELTTVNTARGVTFRVMESPLMVKMVEALGANAVPMAGSEMYTAMQNGTVDGQENPIGPILNDRTYEVQKYMVVDNHVASIVCYTMSYKFFQGLPADLQKVVLSAAKEAGIKSSEATADINARGLSMLRERGLKIYVPTPTERAAWHAPIFSACSEYVKSQLGANALDGLQGAIAANRKK